MTFTESVKTCFKKYADFSGRATRSEYWYFVLFNFIVSMVISYGTTFIVLGMGVEAPSGVYAAPLVSMLYSLAVLLPSIAVAVRRLHDVGKSGWYYFFVLIPLIGPLYLIYLFVKASDGENQYGLPLY